MIRLYYLLIILLPFEYLAQPVIDDSWTPVIGDSYPITILFGNLDIPSAGANQTWDYSNITLGPNSSINCIDPSTTPYGADYPNANLALHDLSNSTYNYYEANTTQILDLGHSNTEIDLVYSNPLLHLPFPLTYGDSVGDNTTGSFEQGDAIRTIETSIKGYGYGDLILASSTLNNILCVKVEQSISDDYGPGGIETSTFITYLFLAPNESFTILHINEYDDGEIAIKYGFVKSAHVGLKNEISSTNVELQLFPNPITKGEDIKVKLQLKDTDVLNINIIDITGKIVKSLSSKKLIPGTNDLVIESNGLETGVYFVNISANDGKHNSTAKLIVK